MAERRDRAGDSVEDWCRACKLDRMHAVVAADADGRPIRVSCGYCGSEHNYRGGPAANAAVSTKLRDAEGSRSSEVGPAKSKQAFPLVSDRERTAPPMGPDSPDFELLLRR